MSCSSSRGRHKDREVSLPFSRTSNNTVSGGSGNARPSNGSRLNNAKSPKSFKKSFPHHSTQAPPPPPGPAPDSASSDGGSQAASAGTKTENVPSSVSTSQSQSATSAKPEKLSYAQMAQKKNHQNSKPLDSANSGTEGGGAKTSSLPTSPQTAGEQAEPPQSTKSIKSTSTGSLAVGQGQSSGTITSKSAPTTPTKESGAAAACGQGQSKGNEV